MRKQRKASRVARSRRVLSILRGLSGTEKVFCCSGWVRDRGKRMCLPAFYVILWAGAMTQVSQDSQRTSKA